jgi:hypothetical protein
VSKIGNLVSSFSISCLSMLQRPRQSLEYKASRSSIFPDPFRSQSNLPSLRDVSTAFYHEGFFRCNTDRALDQKELS